MYRPRTTLIRICTLTLVVGLAFGCAKPEVLTGIPESLSVTAWNGLTQNATEYRGAVEIDLGTVGAGESSTAWFEVLNDGFRPIELREVLYDMDRQRGERWEILEWLPASDWARRSQLTLPQTLAPGQSLVLGVPFTAASLGSAETEARLVAGQTVEKFVRVTAQAVPSGSPDISVGYGDAPGTTIETTCSQGVCTPPNGMPLVLGTFDAGTPVTVPMHIRNVAHCAVLEGEDACSTCELRVESPSGARGITLPGGFMSDAGFTLETADEPLVIGQADESCAHSGVYSFNLSVAPAAAGVYETTLIVLSNDPDESRIEIPLTVRFNDVAGTDPDIEVTAGSVTGPIVAAECNDGSCVLNGGVAVAMPTVAPGASSSMVVTMRNSALCPAERSCDECALDITGVNLTFTDAAASWQATAPVSSNTLHPERSDCTLPSTKEVTVAANTPMAGTYEASLHITSTDPDESQIEIPLQVSAMEAGGPGIEVEIDGMVGPIVGTDCTGGVCRLGSVNSPIYLGHILPGTNQQTQLYIRNRASCTGGCNSCGLTLQNGVRFANGGTSQSAFSVGSSAGNSTTILRQDASCGEDGLWNTPVSFSPSDDGNYAATLVIESNDSDEPRIEVFLAASSGPEPVAIADVGPCTTAVGYQATCNSDEIIDPMENVRLDGSESFDPSGLSLSRYIWTVDLAPTGSQRTVGEVLDTCYTAWEDNCELYEGMLADLPGQYRACLTVENSEGLQSVQTAASCTTFTVLPPSQLHVQLTWPEVDNADQDLHLVHVENDPRVCNQQSDCHWRNCKPDSMNDAPLWFADSAAGLGANPRLDVDSTSGSKHENINIDEPRAGTYEVYVHYYEWDSRTEGPSEVNVTIWLGGIEVFSSSRTLSSSNAIWRIGNISWGAQGGVFTPYDPYNIGMIGDVEFEPGLSAGSGASTYYCSSIQGGWEFPE